MEPIFRDIQDHSPTAVFPISGPIIIIEDLLEIATTTIVCENKRLKVCLDIPLVDKADYTLYQLHPVPVIRSILRNGSGRAYVRSTFSYIAMKESRRAYILINQEKMDQCKDLGSFYNCPGKSPICETSTREACKSALLNNRTAEAIRLCEVQVSYKKTAEVICPSRPAAKLQLTGIGILQVAMGCSLRTSEMTLPSPSLQRQVLVAIYEPCLHLNLTELSPASLRNSQHMSAPATELRLPKNISNKSGKYKEAEETLDQLEDQLNEISSREQATVKQTILTHGSYLGIGLLAVGLAIYVCRTKLLLMTTGKRYCLQRKGSSGATQATQHLAELGINLEVNPE